jgi:hypothetical protein
MKKYAKQFLILTMTLNDSADIDDIVKQLQSGNSCTVNTKQPENLKNDLLRIANLKVSYEPVTEMLEEEGMNIDISIADTYNFILEGK